MATITRTIGASGADYTSLAAWQTGRAASSIAGDTEEAVLLDTPNTETVTFQASQWADGVTLRIRGNTPHNGDFAAGVIKSGGSWSYQWNSTTKAGNIEFQDVHFDLTSVAAFAAMAYITPSVSGADIGTCTLRSVLFSNGTTANARGVLIYTDTSGQTNPLATTIENAVANGCSVAAVTFGGSQPITHNVTIRASTFYGSRILARRNTTSAYTFAVTGCLFKPNSTDAELVQDGSSGTFSATSERVITSRSQAQHEAVFGTTTGNSYSVSFVDTTPSAGQVAFASITGGDFSLQDHANNLAIDYVTSGTMPSTDIAGETRDASPDAGAFEVPAPVGPNAPTGFVAGTATHNSLQFSWTDNATDEDNYEVDYKLVAAGSWTTWSHVLAANTTSTTITGLAADSTYDIRIRAVNGAGSSAYLTDQMSTTVAPVSTGRSNKPGLSLGLGLGISGRRRGGGSTQAGSQLLWSSASTWAGGVPGSGDNVTIEAGRTVYLDTDTASLGTLTIEGTLIVQDSGDTSLTAQYINVEDTGTLRAGTEYIPHANNFTLTLTGTTPNGSEYTIDPDDGSKLTSVQRKALVVRPGATVDLHGTVPAVTSTRINAHVSAGASSLTLSEPVTWKAGDKIVLSKTDFYSVGDTEMLTVASDVTASTTVPLVETVATARWGVLQYATDSGMSLTPGTLTKNDPNTPEVLDERAMVMHMTRNIVIQGADDASWSTDKFGGHTMVMGLNSTWRVDGVEFRRMGQQHFKGRYPIHFHMLSFSPYVAPPAEPNPSSGQFLGDVDPSQVYTKRCAVHNSSQRALVIHGTCGTLVEDLNAYDILAHAIFEEDGSEQRNTITRCRVMKVRSPDVSKRIKVNDVDSSGYWLTNPDNSVTHNYASDCQGRGFWNSFAEQAFGLSRNVSVNPRLIVIDEFDDNEGHSNLLQGFMTTRVVFNEAGNTTELRYLEDYTPGQPHQFFMRRNRSWKNTKFGYENRVMAGRYENWTMADNDGESDFFGSSLGLAKNRGPLLVHTSLNNANVAAYTAKSAVASYHFEMDFENLVCIGYGLQAPYQWPNGQMVQGGGVMNTGDLYTYGSFYQMGRSFGWKMINSHPGRLPVSPHFDGFPLQVSAGPPPKYRYWTLGFMHDPYGYWDAANPGRWLVWNRPLYTYGLSTTTAVDTDWVSTSDRVYGVNRVQFQSATSNTIGWGSSRGDANVIWHRLDNSNAIIDSHEVGLPSQSQFFSNMGSFMANQNGRFKLEFSGYDLTTVSTISLNVEWAHLTDDTFLIGVPWDGGNTPSRISIDSTGPSVGAVGRPIYLTGSSIADVLADSSGQTSWQDAANDTIWILWKGLTTGSFDRAAPVTLASNNTIGTYTQFLRVTA